MCQKILNFGSSVHDPFKSWILKTSALAQMLSSIADFTSCFPAFFPAVFSISESCNQYSSCVSRMHPRNCLTSVFSGASTENRTWEMSQCCSAIYALSFNVLSTTQIPGAFLCHQPEQPQRGPRKWQIPQTVSQVLISSTSLHPLPYFLSGSHQETFS